MADQNELVASEQALQADEAQPTKTREQICVEALEGVEDPVEFVEGAKILYGHIQLVELNRQLFEFIAEVHRVQEPRMVDLGLVNIADGEEEKIPLVTIWAGIGDQNPLQRLARFRDALNEIDALFTDGQTMSSRHTAARCRAIIQKALSAPQATVNLADFHVKHGDPDAPAAPASAPAGPLVFASPECNTHSGRKSDTATEPATDAPTNSATEQ